MSLQFETSRLLLRPLELSDTASFYLMNNNPKVNKFLRNPIVTKLDAERYIEKIISEYNKNTIGRFAVILKENNKLIGFSGLKFRNQEENNYTHFFDLGYRFSEEYWNQGFAKEAALFWVYYGFNTLKLSVIHACAVNDNIASNELLKKIGFQFTNQYIANNLPHNWYKIENI